MPHNFAGIVFDMDGTLLDSEVIWEREEMAMFAQRGLDYPESVREQVIGLRLDAFWHKLIEIYGLTESAESLMAELQARIVSVAHEIQAKPGAQAIVQFAHDARIPYCIASSSSQAVIDAFVIAQGWADLIPMRYSADLVPEGKPAPDVYLYAAKQLGVDPAQCLAIEDSTNGARSAVAAGMTTYVVPDGHTPASKFDGITPHVFTSLHEILAMLK